MKAAAALATALLLALAPARPLRAESLAPAEMRVAAVQAVAAGRPDLALAMASSLLARDPGDQTALQVRARALRDLGRNAEAEAAARETWASADSPADRYRAAMLVAQALASAEKRTRAQFWLRRAAQNAPTEQMRDLAIRDFRYVRARNPFSASLNFSIAPTSNANGGSTQDTFELFGLPLTLNGAAKALSGVQFAGSAQLRYRLKESARAKTDLNLGLQHTTYRLSDSARTAAPGVEGSDFAYSAITGGIAREWITGDGLARAFTGWHLDFGQNWYGGEVLSRFAELGADRRFALNRTTLLRVAAEAEVLRRFDGRAANARSLTLDATLFRALPTGGQLSFGVVAERSLSDRFDLDYSRASVAASWRLAKPVLGAEVTLRAEMGLRDFENSPYRAGGRRDVSQGLGVDLFFANRDFYGFAPTVTFQGTRRDSNVDLYDTRNLGLQIGIRSVF
ncbi:surface lipoprotein assembly modifier [Oceaniglobus roseus]|uniref:surface lipoprotein assembly modifier n=1 Tax=Oceaniglobus roseus TaxID=1737570 RepID=UPI000C7EE127|nr:surface lipoprotein assembly modifier [Kandeliimicrobium roseum]